MLKNLIPIKSGISQRQRLLHTLRLKELKLKEYTNGIEQGVGLFESDLPVDLNASSNRLLVKLIAAPINPADLNIIQGKYGVLPASLPACLGNEGVFEVCQVEDKNSNFKQGDWVLPNKFQFGSWRNFAVESEANFIKIPANLDRFACSTLSINPVTAYRLIKDFRSLQAGDTIIQNGANSGVGQAVIQLCNLMNINCVNIVRKREDQSELNEQLYKIGAKYVYTEDMLRKFELTNSLWKEIPKPKVALNCVGGRATTDMIRLLDAEATMITYGGMSRQPLMLNTADFIFKDFKAVGFWLTRWRDKNPLEYKRTIAHLCELIAGNQFKAPRCEAFELDNYVEAFKRNSTPFLNSKILFTSN